MAKAIELAVPREGMGDRFSKAVRRTTARIATAPESCWLAKTTPPALTSAGGSN